VGRLRLREAYEEIGLVPELVGIRTVTCRITWWSLGLFRRHSLRGAFP